MEKFKELWALYRYQIIAGSLTCGDRTACIPDRQTRSQRGAGRPLVGSELSTCE